MKRFVGLLILTIALYSPGASKPGSILEKDQHSSRQSSVAMVTVGEEHAARVGHQILRDGGNAVDAATAIAFSLSVTLPRAGNLGGGGFCLILDQKGQVRALDFREKAPAKLHQDFYLQPGRDSRNGASAVGVPGTVDGLWEMHRRYGVLPWNKVVEPAQRLAADGFPVTPWLRDGLTQAKPRLWKHAESRRVFYPQGKVPEVDSLLVQPDLADTLDRIASEGAKGFYLSETSRLLVKGVQEAGGVLTQQDLLRYKAKWREPVSGDFRGYRVYSMPPPSSGGIHLLQMLSLLEPYELKPEGHNSASHLHLIAEAMRLAYKDRALYLGDPDFVKVPAAKLLSPDYIEKARRTIPETRARDSKSMAPELFKNPPKESADTTHFNVVDADGMAVSLTYTLNFSYGSGFMAPGTGFLLNNEMDDFNAKPGQANAYGLIGSSANNVASGKRPLSSMTPTIVTKDGEFFCCIGAPGGSRIINGVFQSLLNLLAYGYNAQTSVTLPRIHHQWFPDRLRFEMGFSEDTRRLLQSMGHQTQKIYAVAHVLTIVRAPDGTLRAGLDPRRPAYVEGY